MSVNRNNVSFVMKYGTPAHVDKIIRSDIPHWDDIPNEDVNRSLNQAVMAGVKNPSTTDTQKSKMLDFPFRSRGSKIALHHAMIMHHPNLAPHLVEKISHLAGESEILDADLMTHKNLTSGAVANVIAAKKKFGDNVEHLEWKKKQLEKAGK